MIDAKRNLNTTYRAVRHGTEGITLKVFPNVPDPVNEGWYRMDQIPQWLIEAMALLDAAAPANIPDLGHRVGELVYWIEPPLRNTAGDRIAAALNSNRAQALLDKWEDLLDKWEDESRYVAGWRKVGVL